MLPWGGPSSFVFCGLPGCVATLRGSQFQPPSERAEGAIGRLKAVGVTLTNNMNNKIADSQAVSGSFSSRDWATRERASFNRRSMSGGMGNCLVISSQRRA